MAIKYTLKKSIKRSGFPTTNSKYREAHSEASNSEKSKYPKGYAKLKKMDAQTPSGQLLGKNTKSGKIYVSSKVPKALRQEVAYHEKMESKAIKRLTKNKSKKR
jgi:hypothetical protein